MFEYAAFVKPASQNAPAVVHVIYYLYRSSLYNGCSYEFTVLVLHIFSSPY